MNILEFDKLLYHQKTLNSLLEGEPAFPVHATISLGNLCNHECLWCSVYEKHLEKAKLTDFDNLVSFLEKAASSGLKAVSYIGNGEPTVYPEFSKLIKKCASLGLQQAMFTNGFLMDRFADEILEHFTWLRVSLDAAREESHSRLHGAKNHFDKIISNISLLKSRRHGKLPTIGVQFAVHDENICEMFMAADISKKAGADYFSIKPVFTRGAAGKKISQNSLTPADISKEAEKISAKLSENSFSIFYRPHQAESVHKGYNILQYDKCYASYFNIIINEDNNIITCGPRGIKVAKITDDTTELIKVLCYGNTEIDVSSCPAGCRYHSLNRTIYDIMNPDIISAELHTNFI